MIVIDTETTGLEPSKYSLLSIGAIDFERPERRFYGECKIFTGALVSSEALAVNGFTEEGIHDSTKMTDRELVEEFIEWAKASSDTTFAGENPSFDRDFLKQTAIRYGLDWRFAHRTVDLHSIAYAYIKGQGRELPMKNGHTGQDLGGTLKLVGIPDIRKTHNALEDALLEAEAFSRLMYKKELLEEYKIYPIPKDL